MSICCLYIIYIYIYIYRFPELRATRDLSLTQPSPLCSHANDRFVHRFSHCSFLLPRYSFILPRYSLVLLFSHFYYCVFISLNNKRSLTRVNLHYKRASYSLIDYLLYYILLFLFYSFSLFLLIYSDLLIYKIYYYLYFKFISTLYLNK